MTPEKKRTAQRWAWWVAILVPLFGVAIGAAKAYDATNVSVPRFQAESVAVDTKQDRDHALLLRIDSTVRQMNTRDSAQFCSAIPAQFRPGCKG